MSRYGTQEQKSARPYYPPAPTYEGDQSFAALNMKAAPDDLQAGEYARGENVRCIRGIIEKRGGSNLPAYANIVPFTEIVGSGIYKNPNGAEEMLIATAAKLYRIASGSFPIEIALPEGVTLTAPVYPVQAFDKVLLGRGPDLPPLQWDGTPTGSFETIAKSDPANTARVVTPNFSRAVAMQSRLLIPVGRTNIQLSDILDYTSCDPIFENFPANLGASDTIVRLFPYAQGTLIIGKEHRLEVLSNFTDPQHPELAQLEELNSEVGTCAWDSWAMFGSDALFLSRDNGGGVFRITQTDQSRLNIPAVPLSDPIQPLIDRINWNYAHLAVAAVQNGFYKLAVPLDGSTVNNAIFNYYGPSASWHGVDFFDPGAGMQLDNLLVFPHRGTRRLFAVNAALRKIHLLEEGKFDDVPGGRYEIQTVFRSRGYASLGSNAVARRDFKRLELGLRTWRPRLSVAELTENANDLRSLTPADPIIRNRRKSKVWATPDYRTSNVNHDHDAPGREDYSVDWTADDPEGIDFGGGIDPELKQSETIAFATKNRGRYLQVELTNTQGDADITGLLLESAGTERTQRRAA